MRYLQQVFSVIGMNIKSLPHRGWMAAASLLAVAIVVAVLQAFLAMAEGFRKTVRNSGSEQIGIALRAGSQAELNSVILADDVKFLVEAPEILRDDQGPIHSGELYVVVDGIKKSTGRKANLSFRGMSLGGSNMRPNFTLVEGEMFTPGKNELIVGQSVVQNYEGFAIGSTQTFGKSTWKVVGVFTSNGSVYESELWGDIRMVQDQFNRGSSYQTVRFAISGPEDLDAIKRYAEQNPQLNIDLQTEQAYFAEQAQGLANIILYVGWPLAIIMAIGALAGALNAMYTSVAQRTREIATLRALGFKGSASFFGTLVESMVLAFLGGLLGTGIAYLFFNGMTASTLGGSFTQVVFDFQLGAEALRDGIVLALVIGLVGGFFPALKAARTPVLKAFSLVH